MDRALSQKVSLWGVACFAFGLFFAIDSWPKLITLSVYGKESVAEVVRISQQTKRECQSRDILCDIGLIDRYKTYYKPTLEVEGLLLKVEQTKPFNKGDKVQ